MQTISEHAKSDFFSLFAVAVEGSLSFTGVSVARKGCNSQTKHCASSREQVMCRTYIFCVLIVERVLIQNNYPAEKKKKEEKNCYGVVFFLI